MSRKTSRFKLSAADLISVPLPSETDSYKPVSHKSLIDITLQCAKESGFDLRTERYAGNKTGTIATAYYDFNYGGDPEMGLRIAWQNSYNKQVTLKFAIGGNVFVCENGCFHGDLGGFKRKHTGDVQIFTPEQVSEYFKTADETFEQLISHRDQLRKINIDNSVKARLIGDMYINEQILKQTQVSILIDELANPSFDHQAKDTAWELYNLTTHALKSVPPSEYLDSHQAVHQFLP